MVPEVVEINPPPANPSIKKVDYLSVLKHITRLGTRHFQGSSDPIEADKWRSLIVRKFSSIRCPDDYQKDIAVHFLEGTHITCGWLLRNAGLIKLRPLRILRKNLTRNTSHQRHVID